MGSKGRGRPRMTWRARLNGDMEDMGLRPGMAMNRDKDRDGNEPREVEMWHHGENV